MGHPDGWRNWPDPAALELSIEAEEHFGFTLPKRIDWVVLGDAHASIKAALVGQSRDAADADAQAWSFLVGTIAQLYGVAIGPHSSQLRLDELVPVAKSSEDQAEQAAPADRPRD
jgi:hypothetical protein